MKHKLHRNTGKHLILPSNGSEITLSPYTSEADEAHDNGKNEPQGGTVFRAAEKPGSPSLFYFSFLTTPAAKCRSQFVSNN